MNQLHRLNAVVVKTAVCTESSWFSGIESLIVTKFTGLALMYTNKISGTEDMIDTVNKSSK